MAAYGKLPTQRSDLTKNGDVNTTFLAKMSTVASEPGAHVSTEQNQQMVQWLALSPHTKKVAGLIPTRPNNFTQAGLNSPTSGSR